jgi:hypothetical protein
MTSFTGLFVNADDAVLPTHAGADSACEAWRMSFRRAGAHHLLRSA